MHTKALIQTTRLPFLILSPICVFLGVSSAISQGISPNYLIIFLTLLGAISAHVSVNTFNEYFDFKSGLDLTTNRTPFSGGSGALPNKPEILSSVYRLAITSLVLCICIGIFFIYKFGMALLPIGLLGILLVVSYTPWLNRHPFLCLVAPGLGFGFVMVSGSQFVLNGEYTNLAWQMAFVVFFLTNNLLLLNQIPDINADKRAGRNHFLIAFGIKKSTWVYAFFNFASVFIILFYIVNGLLPRLSLLALAPMALGFFALYGAIKHQEKLAQFPQYLAANVGVTLLTPLILGLSLLFR